MPLPQQESHHRLNQILLVSNTSSFFPLCICQQGEAGSPGENGVPGAMVRFFVIPISILILLLN